MREKQSILPRNKRGKLNIKLVSFSASVDLINTEKQLIWNRFAAMVVANSINLNFFGFDD